jgi:PAS domain S-box-containing protein
MIIRDRLSGQRPRVITVRWNILDRLGLRAAGGTAEASRAEGLRGDGALKAAHSRVDQMLAASPAVVYATKASGNYACTFVSDNLRSVTGYSPEEMTTDPKHWPDNLHRQDAPRVFDRVAMLIERGGGSVEYRFRHRDGHYIWIQDTFKVIRNHAGQPAELIGAWADISERKFAQEALQKAYDELEKRVEERTSDLMVGRQRLEYVLAVSPAITYATNATGDFECTFISESSRQIMGYSPEEALADKNFWVEHLHPQDAKHVLSDFSRLVAQGSGNLEYRFRHKEGYYRWFQDTFRVLHDDAGKQSEIVGSWADITHRKLADAVRELYSASLERQEPISLKRLDSILETGREVLQLDRLSIFRADAARQWLQALATTGTNEPEEAVRVPIAPAGGALAQAFLTKEVITWDGSAPVPDRLRLQAPYDQIKSLRSRVFAIIPLAMQGQVGGVLVADRKDRRVPFDPATLESLRGLATQATVALEHTRLYAEAQPVISRSLHLSGRVSGIRACGEGAAALRPHRRHRAGWRSTRDGSFRRGAAPPIVGGTEVADHGGNVHRLGPHEQEGPRRARHGPGRGFQRLRVRREGRRAGEHHGTAPRRRHGGRRLLPRQQDARGIHGARRRARQPRRTAARARHRQRPPPARDRS